MILYPVVCIAQQSLRFIMILRQSVKIELILIYPDKPEKHHLRKEQVEDGERQDGAALPPKTVIFKLGLSAR